MKSIKSIKQYFYLLSFFYISIINAQVETKKDSTHIFKINNLEYLEMRGANVMLAHDFYPESHQGGVGLIQNGIRVATNGDLRLEPTPGQWQPVPKVGKRLVDLDSQTISVKMQYPDDGKNGKGFNPIFYPNLDMKYTLKVTAEGESFKVTVDLEEPIPAEWVGKVGMNIELFPGYLFGKSYYMDNKFGIFTRQANGPGFYDSDKEFQLKPMAVGKELVISPEDNKQTLSIKNLKGNDLQLIDGRAKHSNGWFVVRSLVSVGATKNAIEWIITPNVVKEYTYKSVVQVSQVGYQTNQPKIAVIETDKNDVSSKEVSLLKVNEKAGFTEVLKEKSTLWGDFLRYRYYQFDFSKITESGMYVVKYNNEVTHAFQIAENVYDRHVWQPTLEYFLPVQMCHMRVNDRYKVWHGRCHLDDARMAPTNHNHFDGYIQGEETLTKYKSGEHVPGINVGGWHDAGDYDLRVESQASTVGGLSHIYELFDVKYDNTTINQQTKTVEMLQPDGVPDILQQIEHGALSVVGGYKSLGRFYRGIIVPHKRQYILLGDAVNHSDGDIYSKEINASDVDTLAIEKGLKGAPDDRWVFTEKNPMRELNAAADLAAASRSLRGYNDALADDCLTIAKEIWEITKPKFPVAKLSLAVELLKTTKDKKFAEFLIENTDDIAKGIDRTGWIVGPVLDLVANDNFKEKIRKSVKEYLKEVVKLGKETPYGMPYKPNIWGAGWGIQSFGVQQYYLHTCFPDIFPDTYMLNAMNFVLGVHPGVNTSSFASGVGSRSLMQAYGTTRGEHSHIPGGIGSGTALIRPDFPELLEWPFLWQQTEYVLGRGTTDYMHLILAANKLLKDKN